LVNRIVHISRPVAPRVDPQTLPVGVMKMDVPFLLSRGLETSTSSPSFVSFADSGPVARTNLAINPMHWRENNAAQHVIPPIMRLITSGKINRGTMNAANQRNSPWTQYQGEIRTDVNDHDDEAGRHRTKN
jgi:hypothetical protein